MPLQKQNISIPFGQGIDTQTDPNQLMPGQLLVLKDAVFDVGNELIKRNGYKSLLTGRYSSSGYGISTFKNELAVFGSGDFSSYSPSNSNLIRKDLFSPVDLSVSSVVRDTNQQSQQDSAYNANANLYLYTYVDSSLGSSYVVIDGQTGQQMLKGSLASNYVKPRAFAVGNYLVIVAIDNSTSPFTISYFSILTSDIAISSVTSIAATVNTTYPNFDGVVAGDRLYLAWNGHEAAGSIRTAHLDSNLTLQTLAQQVSEMARGFVSCFADNGRTPPFLWVTYSNGTQIKYFVQNSLNLGNVLAPTLLVDSITDVVGAIGYSVNGSGHIYYQTLNNYSYSINSKSVRTDFLSFVSATDAGAVGTPGIFTRSAALASKVALFNNEPFFVTAYGPQNIGSTSANMGFQPTYFVHKAATSGTRAEIVGRLAFGNAGGYSSSSLITAFNNIGGSRYQFGYLFKDLVASQGPSWNMSGGVYFQVPAAPLYSETGVNSAVVDLYNPSKFSTVEMGNNLIASGGQAWAYDGQKVSEQNFHLFPEDMVATSASSANGLLAGTYSYCSVYEWTDNQGNIHRSAPSLPYSITIAQGSSAQVQLRVPTLRLTNKSNVTVVNYRTTPSISSGIFTAINVPQNPILSSTAADSVVFTDFVKDSELNGNSLLYTTGGVLENVGGPAFSFVGKYRNRVMGIWAENKNVIWYSKEVIYGTPVEFSDLQTLFVNPKFGDCNCGIEMDDKWIIFKDANIFYLVGQGPDATGAQNDFSEPTAIPSTVGTKYPKSMVLTQDGVMFKSDKGIWLLDRSLNVSYIGAPVEAYNQYEVTAAMIVPGTTQVRFSLSNGTTLIYDYFHKQWGVFTGWNVLSACVWNGNFTFLNPGSRPYLLQETPGVYSDNGKPILMGLTTAWLSMSGLQGFQRAYRFYLMGKTLSPHTLNVSVAYDYDPNIVQTGIMRPIAKTTYGSDPLYGASQVLGGTPDLEQFRMNLKKQKCQSIQITIQESLDASAYELGPGVALEAIALVYGTKDGHPRLPASKAVT